MIDRFLIIDPLARILLLADFDTLEGSLSTKVPQSESGIGRTSYFELSSRLVASIKVLVSMQIDV